MTPSERNAVLALFGLDQIKVLASRTGEERTEISKVLNGHRANPRVRRKIVEQVQAAVAEKLFEESPAAAASP